MNSEESLNNLLEKVFPKINFNNIKVLDAMCGVIWHNTSKSIYNFFNKKFNCTELVGVEIRADIGLKTKNNKIRLVNNDIGCFYENDFDLILTLRPYPQQDGLKEIYNHLYGLLKKEGLLFATSYNQQEMNKIIKTINETNFVIKEIGDNEPDKNHNQYLIASKDPS